MFSAENSTPDSLRLSVSPADHSFCPSIRKRKGICSMCRVARSIHADDSRTGAGVLPEASPIALRVKIKQAGLTYFENVHHRTGLYWDHSHDRLPEAP